MGKMFPKRQNQSREQTQLLALLRRPSGDTPRARARDRQAIQKLLDAGVDLYFWTRERKTFLDVARDAGHLEGIALLLAQPGAAVPERPDARFAFVQGAIQKGQAAVAMALVDEHGFPVHHPKNSPADASLLHEAAVSAHPRTLIPWLVAHGVEVNPDARTLLTPLAMAVTAKVGQRGRDLVGAVQTLLEHGARIDVACDSALHDGGGVLHELARRDPDDDALAAWRLLLAAGADPRQRDRRGHTPMDLLEIPEQAARRQHEAIQQTGLGAGLPWKPTPGRQRIEALVALHEELRTLPDAHPAPLRTGPRL